MCCIGFFYHVCTLTSITLWSTKLEQLKVFKFDARLTHMKHNFNIHTQTTNKKNKTKNADETHKD